MGVVNRVRYDERTMAGRQRFVADTPLARFLHERIGSMSLQEVERRSKARGVPLLASLLSGYLNGKEALSTDTIRRMSVYFDVPESTIHGLLPNLTLVCPDHSRLEDQDDAQLLRATFATVQRLEREVRLLREQLATYGVASPAQQEVEVSEDPSKPAAEEPLIYRLVREELNKFPGGANIPMDASDTHAQLYDVGGELTEEELRSVAATLARRRWIRWNREHGLA
jgi:hypothetical protein